MFAATQISEKEAAIHTRDLPVINGCKPPMRQVFQNLIGNVLKYSKKDQPPQIHITATDLENHWQFAVADNGIGIDKEYFESIFVIFQRPIQKMSFPETVWDWPCQKKIIENPGGKIWVESQEGKGNTFYFTLIKDQL